MPAKRAIGADGRAQVEAYLARVPEPARTTLEKMRAAIKAAAPKDATEGLSYGVPAFHYRGALVAYAAFKNHCSFFPMGSGVLEELADDLKEFRTSKGTLQVSLEKPLPAALIEKIVKARAAMNEAKSANG